MGVVLSLKGLKGVGGRKATARPSRDPVHLARRKSQVCNRDFQGECRVFLPCGAGCRFSWMGCRTARQIGHMGGCGMPLLWMADRHVGSFAAGEWAGSSRSSRRGQFEDQKIRKEKELCRYLKTAGSVRSAAN
jgi:hypothetical protein